ncbi:hypothetical protein SODALDRAFT_203329 [Sodiomyces alkalinus F11]|uniref:Uncharacterized protein n=1 Tax=Sodiomyces alkalinus (strain CBS 110278 / VKM F-3762 / F11) TaxID=1314773 RepID=A0A3N2PT59_SODAK|nr:hypothetical protein SODALDRAFT_203329 [Sodiomyces alkalinus F11]ROT37697.1 hypothetical protein SODALDRAFT_203329 [Sodiomyces alkalinus F11]
MDPALGQSSSDKSYSPGPGSIMTSSSRDTTPDHSSEGPIRKPGAGVDVVDPSLTLASAVRGPMANHEGGRSEMERALNPTSNPFVVGAVQRRSKPATPSDRHAVQSREKQPHQPQPMQRLHSASTNPNSGGGGGPGEGAGGVIGGSSRNSITGPPRYFDSPSWHPGLVGSTTPTTTAKTVTTTPTNLLSGCFPPPSPQVTSGGGAHYMAMRMDARPEPPGLLGAGGGNLENFYAYCFDRGNGNYARLIPADMLPPLAGIPAFQQGSEGMIVLPLPQGLPPRGPMSNIQPVMLKVSEEVLCFSCAEI